MMNLEIFQELWGETAFFAMSWQQLSMIGIALLLIVLGLRKQLQPMLILPIAFAVIMVNLPGSDVALSAFQSATVSENQALIQNLANLLSIDLHAAENNQQTLLAAYDSASISKRLMLDAVVESVGYQSGILYIFYEYFITTGLAPLLLFLCVGAMTDWRFLLARPSLLFIGLAAPFGILSTFFAVLYLSQQGILTFNINQAAALATAGSGDGLSSLIASKDLAPELLPLVLIVVYAYIALLPLVQPWLIRSLVSEADRAIAMPIEVSEDEAVNSAKKAQLIALPVLLFLLVALFLPKAIPLIGMLCLGNFLRESGLLNQLSSTLQQSILYLLTFVVALAIGSQLQGEKILNVATLVLIIAMLFSIIISTCIGIWIAKFLNAAGAQPLNPLLGAAGISAPPVSAYLIHQQGVEADAYNELLLPAMSVNIAGLLTSIVCISALMTYFAI